MQKLGRDPPNRTEKAPKPSVFSPLAIRVTEASSVSSQEQPSADAVSSLSFPPVQRLSNRENVPAGSEKADSNKELVERVLDDAERFLKPFKICQRRQGSSGNGNIPLSNDPSVFSLKKVSPLPAYSFEPERPGPAEALPPSSSTKKRRRASKDSRSEVPAKKNRSSDSLPADPIPEKAKNMQQMLGLDSLWVIPMVVTHRDLGQRIHTLLPSQSSYSDADKLNSLRFLLKGLRVPSNNSNPSEGAQRPLSASVIIPRATRVLSKRFVDSGTATTPRQLAACSTQYERQRLLNTSAQTVPPSVASAHTHMTPHTYTSTGINTDSVRMENGVSSASIDYHLRKLLRCNQPEIDRTIQE